MQKDLTKIFGDVSGLDERSLKVLVKALEDSNLPGFDYLEFKQAVQRLIQEMGMDEHTAIKSAFATASTVVSKEKLLKTARHYQSVLEKEKSKFDAALKKRLDERVLRREKEVEKLKAQVAQWKAQIAELQKKVTEAEEVLARAGEELQSELDKLEATKAKFEHTWRSILNQIAQDVTQLEALLPD